MVLSRGEETEAVLEKETSAVRYHPKVLVMVYLVKQAEVDQQTSILSCSAFLLDSLEILEVSIHKEKEKKIQSNILKIFVHNALNLQLFLTKMYPHRLKS